MPEMKEVTREKYALVLEEYKNDDYILNLKGWQVPIIHGLIALAADHPGIQRLGWPTKQVIAEVRSWCKDKFIEWGFTTEEAEYLDKMREER
jgi:hypothetical protein